MRIEIRGQKCLLVLLPRPQSPPRVDQAMLLTLADDITHTSHTPLQKAHALPTPPPLCPYVYPVNALPRHRTLFRCGRVFRWGKNFSLMKFPVGVHAEDAAGAVCRESPTESFPESGGNDASEGCSALPFACPLKFVSNSHLYLKSELSPPTSPAACPKTIFYQNALLVGV